jgi:hypothetical protein
MSIVRAITVSPFNPLNPVQKQSHFMMTEEQTLTLIITSIVAAMMIITLFIILDEVKQFKTAYQRYQRDNRFDKLSAEGKILPDTATEWAAIQDNETGLMWEVKTNDEGLQDSQHTYTWFDPDDEIGGKENGGHCQGCRCDTAAYVEAINEMQLVGANDWQVPTIDELEGFLKSLDKRYFPHIQPDWYCSSTPHSSDEDRLLCFYVETGQRGHNQYGYGHLILTR